MKLTKDVKTYIRNEIVKRAEEAKKPLVDEEKRIRKETENSIEIVRSKLRAITDKWSKEAVALARKHGLELKGGRKYVSHDVSDYYVETPKRIKDICKAVSDINSRVEREFGRIVFEIEVGKDKRSIEELLAGMRF